MTTFIIISAALILLLLLTVRIVRQDGYGHRPPPRSHEPWSVGTLPDAPYRSLR